MFRPFKTLREIWEESGDQTGIRLLMMVALLMSPIASGLLFIVLLSLRAMVGLFYFCTMFLIGRRYITINPILHPILRLLREIDIKFCDIERWKDTESYFFLTTKSGNTRPLAQKILMAPFVWLAVAMAILLII